MWVQRMLRLTGKGSLPDGFFGVVTINTNVLLDYHGNVIFKALNGLIILAKNTQTYNTIHFPFHTLASSLKQVTLNAVSLDCGGFVRKWSA